MAWFKVDDNFDGHGKARRAGLEAIGLWTVAGAHCGRQLTDGVIPGWFVASWPDGDVLAKALVDADLWHAPGHDCPDCPQPPDGSWVFHEWLQANPSREQVLADRAAAKARQQRHRAGRNGVTDSVSHGVGHGVSHGVTDGVTNAVSHTTPSRPVPTSKSVVTLVEELTRRGDTEASTTTLNRWVDKYAPGIDIDTETHAFLARNDGQRVTDLGAAWKAWIRKAVDRQKTRDKPTPTPSTAPLPTADPDDVHAYLAELQAGTTP